ncbi:MAG: hypothetical protein JSW68_09790 [Burkholderiales bacterium]|nr:MAG: hypothetical protein JSW68_09790 [Burkholderiales bacterium]
MVTEALRPLVEAVQRNCDLADAMHAQELSLCTYLLEMRELYRWERGLALGAAPDRRDVGRWISERAAHWDRLTQQHAESDYGPLPLASGLAVFEDETANLRLAEHGLVYGAGIGRFGRPEFFLAERAEDDRRDGAGVIIAGRELARGLSPPLAFSRGDRVVVRSDALRRWLWTRLEVAHRRPEEDPLRRALGAEASDPEAAIEALMPVVIETLILHELGERQAGELLGPEWERMLSQLNDRRAELAARAVRDLLADCISTLPTLLDRDARAGLHFWFGSFEGARRLLGDTLPAAYRAWCAGDAGPLRGEIAAGRERWRALAEQWLQHWRGSGPAAVSEAAGSVLAGADTRPPNG